MKDTRETPNMGNESVEEKMRNVRYEANNGTWYLSAVEIMTFTFMCMLASEAGM